MKKLFAIFSFFLIHFITVYSQPIHIAQGKEKYAYDDGSYATVELIADTSHHILFKRYSSANELLREQVCLCKALEVSARQYDMAGSERFLIKDGYDKTYDHSKLQQLSYYISNIQQGDKIEYFVSGQVKRLSHFLNGHKTDTLKTFYENGKLQFSVNFVRDIAEGEERYYYPTGALKMVRNRIHDKYEGLLQTWYPGGQLRRTEQYKNDDVVSSKCYAVDGKDTAHYERFDSLQIINYDQVVIPLLQYIHDSCSNKPKITIYGMVEKNGKIGNIEITPSLGSGKTDTLLDLIYAIKWKPLAIDNEPVVSEVAFTFTSPIDPTNTKPRTRTPFWFYATQDYWLVRNYFEYGQPGEGGEHMAPMEIPFNGKKDATFSQSTSGGNDLYKQILDKNRGKILLLNYWMPHDTNSMYNIGYLQKLRYQFGRNELSIVNLCSSNTSEADWKSSVTNLKLPGNHYLLTNNQDEYMRKVVIQKAFPQFLLFDRKGEEIKLPEGSKSPGYIRHIRQLVVGEEYIFSYEKNRQDEYFTIEPYPSLPFHVLLKEFYEDGTLRNEQVFISRIKGITAEVFSINRYSSYIIADGYRKQYYTNGAMKEQSSYAMGVQSGNFTSYYSTGKTQKSYNANPQLNGMYTCFYPSGQLQVKAPMTNGKITGKETIFYPNGNTRIACNYKDGLLDGKVETFFDDGKPKRLELHSNNKLQKTNCFARNGSDTIHYALFDTIGVVGQRQKLRQLIVYLNKLIPDPAQLSINFTVHPNRQFTLYSFSLNKYMLQNSLRDSVSRWIHNHIEFTPFGVDGQPCPGIISLNIELPLNPDSFSLHKELECLYNTSFQDYWRVQNNWTIRPAEWDKPFIAATFYKPQGTGPEVYQQIVDKYKGKVIFIDFWATWCVPCKNEMPFSRRLHAQFKPNELSMVYLCTFNSPLDDWQKTVNELRAPGDHYLLTPEQTTYFSRRFSVNFVPRYMLIDKKGARVNSTAERPSDPILAERIRILLSQTEKQ
jgi:antitoxin component YwqK of YwqJK toxin-antitoxin module/thiol-disulfide isomerase/thioredoxin